ncbi:hypothetical protein [uncultured Chitinophaga sp.]|jgi:hypothetical protein|uniref:hypothetical protein n=1 Tax=uncultured Chitinophaga sp. TaxID=339340 RepID=UPI0026343554|nr:hypothetical protein [uncultured Chitinophaga sp.]
MKNHLTLLGLSFALCTFIVAQASTNYRPAPVKYSVDQQDTSKKKMHKKDKKWKKDKDTSWHKEPRDTSALRIENR